MKNTFIGTPMERREDLRFLRGRGEYVDDVAIPGLLYAVILRSSVSHGRLLGIDASAALHMPGVHAVITVQPGDTVESLSHRMAGVDRPTERFRILNGLDAHAQVKVRDLVKIVVD